MFLIAICHLNGDKWQWKILFIAIFYLHSSMVLSFSIAAYLVCYSSQSSNNINNLSNTVLSADKLHEQLGSWSDPTFCRAWSGSKLFDTDGIQKEFFENLNFDDKNSRRQKCMQNYPVCKALNMQSVKYKTRLRWFFTFILLNWLSILLYS